MEDSHSRPEAQDDYWRQTDQLRQHIYQSWSSEAKGLCLPPQIQGGEQTTGSFKSYGPGVHQPLEDSFNRGGFATPAAYPGVAQTNFGVQLADDQVPALLPRSDARPMQYELPTSDSPRLHSLNSYHQIHDFASYPPLDIDTQDLAALHVSTTPHDRQSQPYGNALLPSYETAANDQVSNRTSMYQQPAGWPVPRSEPQWYAETTTSVTISSRVALGYGPLDLAQPMAPAPALHQELYDQPINTHQPQFESLGPAVFVAPAVSSERKDSELCSWDDNSRPPVSETPRRAVSVKKPPRKTKDVVAKCTTCENALATLFFRGSERELAVPHKLEYACCKCTGCPPPNSRAPKRETKDSTVPPQRTVDKTETGQKRGSTKMQIMTCDVCQKEVGHGEITATDPDAELDFTVENICAHCVNTYKRCTDCGGGANSPRLGIGKWRAKEVFETDRRTCRFSHLRMGTLEDMSYDVWPATSIPPTHLEETIALCKKLYLDTILRRLAVPEILESSGGSFSSHEAAFQVSDRTWSIFEAYFRQSSKANQDRKTYVVLRWEKPKPRKASGKQEVEESVEGDTAPDYVLRKEKTLTGLVLGEMNLATGRLYIPLIIPNHIGGVFDTNTQLMEKFIARVRADLDKANASRKSLGQPIFPLLKEVSTIVRCQLEVRVVERRGYCSLNTYLGKHPEVTKEDFSPPQPKTVPPKLLALWQVYVKNLDEDASWGTTGVKKS